MKNLNKKIGALALAGMVLAGGVAMSGVSAHANEFENIYESLMLAQEFKLLSKDDKIRIKAVEEACERQGAILYDVSRDSNKINNVINKNFKEYLSSSELKKLLEPIKVGASYELESDLGVLKRKKEKRARFIYRGLDFLILFKAE